MNIDNLVVYKFYQSWAYIIYVLSLVLEKRTHLVNRSVIIKII